MNQKNGDSNKNELTYVKNKNKQNTDSVNLGHGRTLSDDLGNSQGKSNRNDQHIAQQIELFADIIASYLLNHEYATHD